MEKILLHRDKNGHRGEDVARPQFENKLVCISRKPKYISDMPTSNADRKLAYNRRFREVLHNEFTKRLKKNPAYSMRAFAKFLEVDQSLLSKVMREQRSLSITCWENIGKKLELTATQVQALLSLENESLPQILQLPLDANLAAKTEWTFTIEKSRLFEFKVKIHRILHDLEELFRATSENQNESQKFTLSLSPSINDKF